MTGLGLTITIPPDTSSSVRFQSISAGYGSTSPTEQDLSNLVRGVFTPTASGKELKSLISVPEKTRQLDIRITDLSDPVWQNNISLKGGALGKENAKIQEEISALDLRIATLLIQKEEDAEEIRGLEIGILDANSEAELLKAKNVKLEKRVSHYQDRKDEYKNSYLSACQVNAMLRQQNFELLAKIEKLEKGSPDKKPG